MLPAQLGHTGAIAELLKHDVDVNTRDDNGVTALSVARYFKQETTVQFLLAHGAWDEGHRPILSKCLVE